MPAVLAVRRRRNTLACFVVHSFSGYLALFRINLRKKVAQTLQHFLIGILEEICTAYWNIGRDMR
jgi:hypothetical protein